MKISRAKHLRKLQYICVLIQNTCPQSMQVINNHSLISLASRGLVTQYQIHWRIVHFIPQKIIRAIASEATIAIYPPTIVAGIT
jgi:hypothetical protein